MTTPRTSYALDSRPSASTSNGRPSIAERRPDLKKKLVVVRVKLYKSDFYASILYHTAQY